MRDLCSSVPFCYQRFDLRETLFNDSKFRSNKKAIQKDEQKNDEDIKNVLPKTHNIFS
jgi:hypothetical protein